MATHPPGTPIWADLGTPDLQDTIRFYTNLFGWTFLQNPQPEAGGYTLFMKDEKTVAGAGPKMSEDQPTLWSTYLSTDDADAVARRVEAAGGKVVMSPTDIFDQGRMAFFSDQAGAVFGVWQPMAMTGAELFNVPGTVTWNELTTRDPDGSKAFYGGVFGWEPEDTEMGPVTYTSWKLNGRPIGGMMPMIGDEWPADVPPHWMVYFAVVDPDATATRAVDLGGAVSVPPTDLPQGRFAVLNDPQGAAFSVIVFNP